MLADDIKEAIQAAYSQLLQSQDLKPRGGQKQMIATIANSLAQEAEAGEGPICVVEAGTGTGKTLAYLLAAIPVAQARGLKLIVATATVALQEQVVLKDIPELLQGSDLDFSYTLAKGRGRYVCLAQLDNRLRPNDSLQAMLELYGEDLQEQGESATLLYQQMLDALGEGSWQGDRDDWPSPISDVEWRPLTVDNSQCLGSRCSFFRQCCFFKGRESLEKADVIVTNQDLVLSDLALGGGVILPNPSDSLYVFDEAHHLAIKSNNHFSNFARVRSTLNWLDRVQDFIGRLDKEDIVGTEHSQQLKPLRKQCQEGLEELWALLQQIVNEQPELDSYGTQSQFPFELGRVPEPVQTVTSNLALAFQQLCNLLQMAADDLAGLAEEAPDAELKDKAEQWFPLAGSLKNRGEATLALLLSFAKEDAESEPPTARWLTISDQEGDSDIGLSVSPVLAASNLQETLWSECAGAVMTSATLSALGKFDVLAMRAGLPERTSYLSIPSPFNFTEAAGLYIPRLNCDPTDPESHTAAIVKALPQLLPSPVAALMLFSSRRQMQDVLAELPEKLAEMVLCQDDYQKAQLLKYHRQRIDDGKDSLIFGLASFAEGVDLPGKYCTHVLIAKIPFAVPNDPVAMTLAEWVEQQGKNPFTALSVPDAAFRLVQSSGRLLRSETDSGRITLFDERIVQKFYGKQILDSLPPYRREVFTEEY
ncbi:MAG: ATP-dependent DNA helicase DinG [Pseudomonadales bacterium]|nr:ATP-dependent DNA helicase DinG [Pseudomonadales bacterium]